MKLNNKEKEKVYLFSRNDRRGVYTRVFRSRLSAMGCLLEDYNNKSEELKNENILNGGKYDLQYRLMNDTASIVDLKDGVGDFLYFATVTEKEIEE